MLCVNVSRAFLNFDVEITYSKPLHTTEIIVLSRMDKKAVARSDRLALVLLQDARFQDTIPVQELAIAVVRLQPPHTSLS